MWWSMIILFFVIPSIDLSSSSSSSLSEDVDCYFHVFYSNGSSFWCLDEECSLYHIDLISLENIQCQTNYLSLRFSSYLTYTHFLRSSHRLSSFFSSNRSNIERLLQIEILTPLNNDELFKLDHLNLLSNSIISNIDTYELTFPGRIVEENIQLLIDEQMFLSTTNQYFIDTLRLIFNCSINERVEWEFIQSIQTIPNSPCYQQITLRHRDFLQKQDRSKILILTILIAFVCLMIIGMIILLFYYYYSRSNLMSDSRMELITMIERF